MIEPVHLDDIRSLIERTEGPCISIYLPTQRIPDDGSHDRLVMKGLVDQAASILADGSLRTPEVSELLAPARSLLDDPLVWRDRSGALAVFLTRGRHAAFRVPLDLEPLVLVGDRFDVKPLLASFVDDGRFLLLALSQGETTLLACDRRHVEPVPLASPTSLEEAMRFDDLEKQRQMHVAGRMGSGAPAIRHGHGVGDEVDRELLVRFMRRVDDGVRDAAPEGTLPLVLAGTVTVVPVFREVSRYPWVVEGSVEGSPNGIRSEELRDRAWELVEPVFASRRAEAVERFEELHGRGERATRDLGQVLRAAFLGAVDTLWVAVGEQRWGRFDATAGSMVLHQERRPGDEDLLDTAAVQTLLRSGTVYAVPPSEVPGGTVAAILRYREAV